MRCVVDLLGFYSNWLSSNVGSRNNWSQLPTKRLYCVEWHNTVGLFTRSGQLSVHKHTSGIRRCLVSRACDWVMSALSDALLIFSSQFNLLFFSVTVTMPHQHCGVLLFLMRNIGHRTLPKIWVGTFLVRNIQYRELDAALYLGTHHNIGSKKAFFTGVLDRRYNCLLIYWHNVAQRAMPTSVCLL